MSERTAVVTGGTRGFGRGIAAALSAAGYRVVTVARTGPADVVADAAAPGVAERLLAACTPSVVVLNAGAVPHTAPLPEQTWETFARPWEVDVRQAFEWCKAALLRPMAPGGLVVALSSGAAIGGSPVSGGYAGAKATVRFIARYADEEAARRALGVRFVALLPGLSPGTGVGDAGASAYAARQGITPAEFAVNLGPVATPSIAGAAVAALAADPAGSAAEYRLTADGLKPL